MNNYGDQLSTIIQAVRRRRNMFAALRGSALTIAIAAAILILAGMAAYRYRYSTGALVSLRIVALLCLIAAAYFALVRPLRRKIGDAQIARLIEERHAGLGDRMVSAVEYSNEERSAGFSSAIVGRLIDDADRRAGEVDIDGIVPRKRFWQAGGAVAASLLLLTMALVFGPNEIREGVKQLVDAGGAVTASNAPRIDVKPGTARVPKGSDQKITASTINFNADRITIFTRKAAGKDDQWAGVEMELARNKGEFQFFIFNIQEDTEYFVESPEFRSEVFKLTVADLPYVKRLDQTQYAPAYTGLPPKTIEDAPDIAVLAGTNVKITAILTGKAKAARIVLSDGTQIHMESAGENNFAGTITVNKTGSYHIEITSIDGDSYNGSNEYDITLLEDRPPTVSFEKPGRDARATSIEEVFTQAKAEDDYGVTSLDLYFSVNGGEEKKVDLQKTRGDSARVLSGAHTFFLEEYGLTPGDLISYYAKARDARNETTSDIYFIEVKPFEKDYKQSQQGGGGGGEQDQQGLTRRQKEIVAATFRINREEPTYSEQEKTENYNTVTLSQEKLYADATTLIDRIKRRMGEQLNQDSDFVKLVEHLTQAAKEMEPAINNLKARKGKDAIPHEQKALQQLMRADAIFREMQLAFGQDGQGNNNAQAEELADLFELELDKMKNQYETLRRERQQQSQKQDDETKRRLEELSRRMQREIEQQQQRMQQGARNGGGGGGRQQQQMIDEARKTARELERLSRERRDPQLMDLSNKLNQAADEMQRAQNAAQNNKDQESVARNLKALRQMEDAQRRLGQLQQSDGGKSIEDLRRRAQNAASRQDEISKDVEDLANRARSGDQSAGGARRNLAERKDALANEVGSLERDLDQTARGLGQEQQAAANKLREAANSLRQNHVSERIRRAQQLIDNNSLEAARAGEKVIQQNLDEIAQQLQEAQKNAQRKGPGGEAEEALDRARQLADNVESMRRRLGQSPDGDQQQGRANQGRQNQQGNQPGSQNQQGNQPGNRPNGQQQGNQPGGQQQGNQQGNQPGNRPNGQQQGNQSGNQQQGNQQRGQQGGQQIGGQTPGQDQNRGQNGGSQNGRRDQGMPNPQSPNMPSGGGPVRGIDDRQLGSELRQYLRDAEDLRRNLNRDRDLTRNLDQAIQALRQAGDMITRDDTATAAMLKTQVIDPLRSIEMELSKRLQAKLDKNNLRLSDEGAAPERYRKLVDEYYKRLSSQSQ